MDEHRPDDLAMIDILDASGEQSLDRRLNLG